MNHLGHLDFYSAVGAYVNVRTLGYGSIVGKRGAICMSQQVSLCVGPASSFRPF